MSHSRTLTGHVQDYLRIKRQLGFELRYQGPQLLAFARFAKHCRHQGPVTLDLILRWASDAHSERPITAAKRVEVLRPFTRYLQQYDSGTEVPPPRMLGSTHHRPVPHIYSDEEVTELLVAARHLSPRGGLRPSTYETLFGLLAATGMRISEALNLERSDVMLEQRMLRVRNSKFKKSRVIPLHATTIAALKRYERVRDHSLPLATDHHFFLSDCGCALKIWNADDTFSTLRRRLGWVARGDHPAPRIHDLRHTFISNCLLRWYRRQINVDNAIAALSTYVGHVRVTDTYWYINTVPQLMAIVSQRFECYAREISNEHP
ncbi:tyrosine-type recombinase/integrase [Paraburkholderia azotifigens]|uniref:Tyrosine-type recombinase/integrase n=1 Tax=Paraburkholderia azotifigens TaxID=2057004 RepID=A0A5C6VWI9_9BURK|nr:tyrosine-type recombinase/integrase [Paraburkholderia azotifigens]TXC88874.1 tyrosine-type recombinase/integrase [Paraburkholderia azotifigens]